jgi:hypothetical protein
VFFTSRFIGTGNKQALFIPPSRAILGKEFYMTNMSKKTGDIGETNERPMRDQ